MYVPNINKVEDRDEIMQFINTYNFASVISQEKGLPVVSHIPIEPIFLADELYLRGHLAKANSQWKTFVEDQSVLITFMESHTYISSSWYEQVDVPTWNYVAVHMYGKPRIFNDDELLDFVTFQMNKYEAASENPVKMEHLDSKYINRSLRSIVGFEIKVNDIQAKYKLSQNKPELTFQNIVRELEQRADENSHKIAEAMKQVKK